MTVGVEKVKWDQRDHLSTHPGSVKLFIFLSTQQWFHCCLLSYNVLLISITYPMLLVSSDSVPVSHWLIYSSVYIRDLNNLYCMHTHTCMQMQYKNVKALNAHSWGSVQGSEGMLEQGRRASRTPPTRSPRLRCSQVTITHSPDATLSAQALRWPSNVGECREEGRCEVGRGGTRFAREEK